MKFYEYNVREIFSSEEIITTYGEVALSPLEAYEIAKKIQSPVVLKAQVLTGGRGKAGGVSFAENPEAAKAAASELFAKKIEGYHVNKILVAKKELLRHEYYLGITINFQNRKTSLIFSTEGGIDV